MRSITKTSNKHNGIVVKEGKTTTHHSSEDVSVYINTKRDLSYEYPKSSLGIFPYDKVSNR